MIGASISINDKVSPVLNRMRATLAERRDLNEEIGAAVEELCKTYVQQDAGNRHASAARVGGTPTGFLGNAVEGISFDSDEHGATVQFRHPWFAAVGHDVTIVPGTQTPGVTHLAIAIDSEAYGHRPMIGSAPRFPGSFVFKSKAGNLLLAMRVGKGKDAKLRLLYYLAPSVTQKQDRTRLPGDADIKTAALGAAQRFLEEEIAHAGKLEETTSA